MADRTKTISASFAVRYVAQDGADAEYYNLVLSSDTIKKDSEGNALTALTASVQYIVGATITEYTTTAELSAAGITITYSANSLADNIFGTGVSVSTTALSEIEAYVGVQMRVNGSVYTSKKVFIVQDGADGGGEDAIVMALSNSASVVLCQKDGTVIDETGGYETTTAYMYDGTTDVTDDTTFAISSTSGITATISGNVISVSDITEDNAGVQIKGTYNENVRYSYYSVKKICAGADATFYRLIVGMTNIPCDSDGAVTISTIPLTVQKVQGETITNLTDYSDVKDEGLNITADLTSTDNEVSKGYYINDMDCPIASMVLSEEGWTGTFASVTFYLHPSSVTYNSGSDYDYQTINATKDGTAGTAGTNAVQFYFSASLILHKVSSSSTTYSVTITATEGATALTAGSGNGTFSAEPASLPTGVSLATSAASGTSVIHTFVVSASAEPSGAIMFALDATTSDGETISKTQSLYIETVADGADGADGEDANAISFTPMNVTYTPTTKTAEDDNGNEYYTGFTLNAQSVEISVLQNGVAGTGAKLYLASASISSENCGYVSYDSSTAGDYNEAAETFTFSFYPTVMETISSSASGLAYSIPASSGSITFTFYVIDTNDKPITDDDGTAKVFTHTVYFTTEFSAYSASQIYNANLISTTIGELSTSVDGLTEKYTEISQTAEEISLIVNNINVANPNLLRNSLFNAAKNIYGGSTFNNYVYTSETLQAGTTYTLAVRGYVNDDAVTAGMMMRCRVATSDLSYSYNPITISTAEETTYYATFEPEIDAVYYFYFFLRDNDTGSGGDRTTAMGYVKWAKIEEGSSFTGYIRNTADADMALTDGENILTSPLAVKAAVDTTYATATTITDNRLGKVLQLVGTGVVSRYSLACDFGMKSSYTDHTDHLITYFVIAKNTSGGDSDYFTFSARSETTDDRILDTLTCEYVDVGSGWKLYYISYQTKTFSSSSDTEGTSQPIVSSSSYGVGINNISGTWKIWAAGVVADMGAPAPGAVIENYQTLATGISITDGTITCTADNFTIQNNSGVTTMTVNDDGQIEGMMFKSVDNGEGTIQITDGTLCVYDSDGLVRIQMGMFTPEEDEEDAEKDTGELTPYLRFFGYSTAGDASTQTVLYNLGPSSIMSVLEENLQSVENFAPMTFEVFSITEYLQSELYNQSSIQQVLIYMLSSDNIISNLFCSTASTTTKLVYKYTPFQFGDNYLAGSYASDAEQAENARGEYFSEIGSAGASTSVIDNSTMAYGIVSLSSISKVTSLSFDYSSVYSDSYVTAATGITTSSTSAYARTIGIFWKNNYGSVLKTTTIYSSKKYSSDDCYDDYMDE